MKFKDKKLLKREQKELTSISNKLVDYYGDFYITHDNLRLYIKDNLNLLFEMIAKGDKLYWNEDSLVLITGYSDNFNRKYLKILTSDIKKLNKLLSEVLDNLNICLYCKIKKANPLINLLYVMGFKFFGSRGKEMLLLYKGEERVTLNNQK